MGLVLGDREPVVGRATRRVLRFRLGVRAEVRLRPPWVSIGVSEGVAAAASPVIRAHASLASTGASAGAVATGAATAVAVTDAGIGWPW